MGPCFPTGGWFLRGCLELGLFAMYLFGTQVVRYLICLECVSKLKLMNYREEGLANYRRIVYNRRSKNNEGAQIKWQDDTKLMMHSGKE